MNEGEFSEGRVENLFLAPALSTLMALFPRFSYAAGVGCFCTFIFVSIMFMIGMGIALLSKRLLSRYVWNTTWKKIVVTTLIELFMIALIFAVVQTDFFVVLAIYLPFALLLNMKMLKKGSPNPGQTAQPSKKLAMSFLSSLALPASIQIAGMLSKIVSGMITFAEDIHL